eukprot:10013677-Ditylum_brightwellii.AAC.1
MSGGHQGKKTLQITPQSIILVNTTSMYAHSTYIQLILQDTYQDHRPHMFCEGVLNPLARTDGCTMDIQPCHG